MGHQGLRLAWRHMLLVGVLSTGLGFAARAEAPPAPAAATTTPAKPDAKSTTPEAKPAPSTPETKTPPSATPPSSATATPEPGAGKPAAKPPSSDSDDMGPNKPLAPDSKPGNTEIEPNAAPGVPENATTENVDVPSRTAVLINGKSSYDDAFKSIRASLASVKAAMEKAGLKPTGHPITVFSEPDDKGFKYQAGVPIAAKPDKADLPKDVVIGATPSGKAIKFQHRGAYEDIDSTYDVITAYLDAKGLQVDSPYIEEYLTDLTSADDPNLQVDIYVFVK